MGFNREVGEDAALYWTKEEGNLLSLIDRADKMNVTEMQEMGARAKKRIAEAYTWEEIADKYEKLFLEDVRG